MPRETYKLRIHECTELYRNFSALKKSLAKLQTSFENVASVPFSPSVLLFGSRNFELLLFESP